MDKMDKMLLKINNLEEQNKCIIDLLQELIKKFKEEPIINNIYNYDHGIDISDINGSIYPNVPIVNKPVTKEQPSKDPNDPITFKKCSGCGYFNYTVECNTCQNPYTNRNFGFGFGYRK